MNLNLAGECEECKRRAEEAKNPRPSTLEEQIAYEAQVIREYERIQAELAEAKRLNDEEDAARREEWKRAGIEIPNVLCYLDQDLEDTGSRNGSA